MTTPNIMAVSQGGRKAGSVKGVGRQETDQKTRELASEIYGSFMSRMNGSMENSQPNSGGIQIKKSSASENTDYRARDFRSARGDIAKARTDTVRERITSATDQVENAGGQILQKVRDQLGVSEDEVRDALSQLGLTVFDLLNPRQLGSLIMEIKGTMDFQELLTDQDFQMLMSDLGELGSGLLNELKLKPEQMADAIEQMDEMIRETDDSTETTTQTDENAGTVDQSGNRQMADDWNEADTKAVVRKTDSVMEPVQQDREKSPEVQEPAIKAVVKEQGTDKLTEKTAASRQDQSATEAQTAVLPDESGKLSGDRMDKTVDNSVLYKGVPNQPESLDGTPVLEDQPVATEKRMSVTEKEMLVPEAPTIVTDEKAGLSEQNAVIQENVVVEEAPQADLEQLSMRQEPVESPEVPEKAAQAEETIVTNRTAEGSELKTLEEPEDTGNREELIRKLLADRDEEPEGQNMSGQGAPDREGRSMERSGRPLITPERLHGEATAGQVQPEFRSMPVSEPMPVQTQTYAAFDTIEFISQLSREIANAVQQQVTTLEMQLNPEHLGKLFIHMVSKEGAVSAQLTVANESVRTAMEAQVAEIRENLEQAGIKVESIEVTVGTHEFEQNLEQNARGEAEQAREQEQNKRGRRNLTIDTLDQLSGLMSDEERLAAQIMLDNGNSMNVTA